MLRICSKECVTDTNSTSYSFAAWQGKQGNVEKNSQHLWLPGHRNKSSTMISEAHDGAPGLFGRPGTHTGWTAPEHRGAATKAREPERADYGEEESSPPEWRRTSLQAASEGITDVSRRRFPLLSSSALTHCTTAPDNWTLDSWRARELIKSIVQCSSLRLIALGCEHLITSSNQSSNSAG